MSGEATQQSDDTAEINGVTYRFEPMPVMIQFHVLRRLAPLITRIPQMLKEGVQPPASPSGSSSEALEKALDNFDMTAIVQPIVDGLSEMNDKDSEFVIRACMKTVRRQVTTEGGRGGVGWVPVWNNQAESLQFQDIDLLAMLQLVFKVLMNFAAPFSSVLASRAR